jgi:farnesyl diphosphate synthase
MDDLELWQATCQTRIKVFLQKTLNDAPAPLQHFFEAMRYASLDGGKRVRAMLTFAVGAYLNVPEEELDIYASAIELIHAFSLVHDDLPAMDNDVLRRGKPTCHVAFGEATAILAGDALLTQAFLILSGTITPYFNSLKRVKMVHALAEASGARGMAGGQYLDLMAENKTLNFEELLLLHRLKTGCLLEVSVTLPLLYANVSADIDIPLRAFGHEVGLLFQIQDDLLDVTGTIDVLGKTPGKDEATHKGSFVNSLGEAGARALLREKREQADVLLASLPNDTSLLRLVLAFIAERDF